MSLRQNLPPISALARPAAGFESDLRPDALQRWNGGVRAAASDTAETINILDVIGRDWNGDGITARRIEGALRGIGPKDVVVNINSPGGDVFEGFAIYNLLREHKGKVTVKVLGLAASIASVIAMAGDQVLVSRVGFLMVHNAWAIAIGNRHDFAAAAATLEPFDDAMAGLYAARAGIDKKAAAKWMDQETWFNGEQAVAQKLADGLLGEDEVATDAAQAALAEPVLAARRTEALLQRAGASRAERRDLIRSLSAGKPGAALDPAGKPGAAVPAPSLAALDALKATLTSLTGVSR